MTATDQPTTAAATMPIKAIILDVDDTLYDVGTGFSDYRNNRAIAQFMVERLGFASLEKAQALRDEYFTKYHASVKALQVAEQEGRFPGGKSEGEPRFRPDDLSNYFAEHLPFDLLEGPKTQLAADLKAFSGKVVGFSNAPRIYVIRVLEELGLWSLMEDSLFAVDDVLPHCKPEKEAFDQIFARIGCRAEECIMVEDSMKNVRRAKELGMRTILITGRQSQQKDDRQHDRPVDDDPAVDLAIEQIEDLRAALPGLWKDTPVFERS